MPHGNAQLDYLVNQAPQLDLLKQTSVCITHAGLNTVLESLAQGVPQVAIPVTFDQPGVAARIAHKRTGVVTTLDKLSADHLTFLVNQVLTDSTYRENARTLQKAIADANGLSRAADLLERAFGQTEYTASDAHNYEIGRNFRLSQSNRSRKD